MSAPKSVIKIDKTGKVTYESNIDAASYFIYELSRAALRDVGKFIAKTFRINYYSVFKKHTGNAGKATKYKVWSSANTKFPRVEIGLNGKAKGFYAYFQEFGTKSGIPRLGLLKKSAEENVAEIVKIESQYLSHLSEEASRLESLVSDDEYEGDGDD